MGFSGKYTIVKDYIREIRPPTRVPAVFRYETEPGVKAQVDTGVSADIWMSMDGGGNCTASA